MQIALNKHSINFNAFQILENSILFLNYREQRREREIHKNRHFQLDEKCKG